MFSYRKQAQSSSVQHVQGLRLRLNHFFLQLQERNHLYASILQSYSPGIGQFVAKVAERREQEVKDKYP